MRKQRIEKSDSLIVIARTPVQQAISDVCNAKDLEKIIRRILKPLKKENGIDRKIDSGKGKKSIKKCSKILYHKLEAPPDFYKNNKPYFGKALYSYKSNVKDSSEHFTSEYMEVLARASEQCTDKLGEKELLNEREVAFIQNKIVVNRVIGTDINYISPEEKEKFNHYKIFNRVWLMLRYEMSGFGYVLFRKEDL